MHALVAARDQLTYLSLPDVIVPVQLLWKFLLNYPALSYLYCTIDYAEQSQDQLEGLLLKQSSFIQVISCQQINLQPGFWSLPQGGTHFAQPQELPSTFTSAQPKQMRTDYELQVISWICGQISSLALIIQEVGLVRILVTHLTLIHTCLWRGS